MEPSDTQQSALRQPEHSGQPQHRAGGRRRQSVQAAPSHPLTPLKVAHLRWIAEYGFLTVPQLAGLMDASLDATRKHLRDLWDHGLVRRMAVPAAVLADLSPPNVSALAYGSAPFVYALSPEGAKLLVGLELVAKEAVKDLPQYGPRNWLFLAHELGVRDVRVWLERCRRTHHHEGVTLWRHGQAALVGRTRPDAFLVYALGSRKLAALVEVDRGTERGEKWWADKLARFGEILTGGVFHELTGLKQGRVLVIAPTRGEARRHFSPAQNADGAHRRAGAGVLDRAQERAGRSRPERGPTGRVPTPQGCTR